MTKKTETQEKQKNFMDLVLKHENLTPAEMVAQYMDDCISEEDLYNYFYTKELVYGLIAMNMSMAIKNASYEHLYMDFLNKMPKTQDDFDAIFDTYGY